MSRNSTLPRLALAILAFAAVAPTAALARSGGGCPVSCGVVSSATSFHQGTAPLNVPPTSNVVAIAPALIGQLAPAVQKPRDPGQASGSSAYYGPAPIGSQSGGAGHPAKN